MLEVVRDDHLRIAIDSYVQDHIVVLIHTQGTDPGYYFDVLRDQLKCNNDSFDLRSRIGHGSNLHWPKGDIAVLRNKLVVEKMSDSITPQYRADHLGCCTLAGSQRGNQRCGIENDAHALMVSRVMLSSPSIARTIESFPTTTRWRVTKPGSPAGALAGWGGK